MLYTLHYIIKSYTRIYIFAMLAILKIRFFQIFHLFIGYIKENLKYSKKKVRGGIVFLFLAPAWDSNHAGPYSIRDTSNHYSA